MNHLINPHAGRAFFRRNGLFVCALGPPGPSGGSRGAAQLAFGVGHGPDGEDFEAALDLARGAGGRHYAIVVERVAAGTDTWPSHEPVPAGRWVVERDGYVVLAPSIETWVHMPPREPHQMVQLVCATPHDGEHVARSLLAQLGTCGLLGRVRAVVHGDSGAEMDAVVFGPDGLKGGYFPRTEHHTPDTRNDSVAADAPAPAAQAGPPTDPQPARAPSMTGAWASDDDRIAAINEALVTYLGPPESPQRLDTFLRERSPEAEHAAIRDHIASVVSDTSNYLWNEKPAVTWSHAFEQRLRQHLESRHAWLRQPGLARLVPHAKWLCWHEGLT